MNFLRTRLLLIATPLLMCGAAHASSTWDITKSGSGSGCTSSSAQIKCSVDGVDLTAKAYYSNSANGTFRAGSLNRVSNDYIGVQSGSGSTVNESTSSPHHAIDNIGSSGATYAELLHLEFSKAVDLISVLATWTGNQHSSSYDADFQIYRWTGGEGTAPTLTSLSANSVASGWALAASADFKDGKNFTLQDGALYSSHWLVTTAFGGTNDAFKLKTFTATVCAYTVTNGACKPPGGSDPDGGGSVPEPGTLALAALGALGVMRMRRKPA
ncbi:PEP-CTERM sorting domain-containing protein [Pseudorhodoferax sp.]|uniref:PEP-CTERM sorting domain-containing protein n=1 Tax=Pseudorhodoferax sp. TaxID=1993553 RepID=UPI002DD6B224|nr:PEP-CTERM sorting domain-containing protein [Pseudorhodoferax sp.]